MKNLKKVLALVLAFACAFTMFAGAAFTDDADIKNADAVDMLVALGVIDGYADGSFKPEGTVTRAEMAKMIYTIRSGGNDDASSYESVPTNFKDIKGHWAEGYIKYCQTMGIISGKSATAFDPNGKVTVAEAAKMALVTLGYKADKAGLNGTMWMINTLNLANDNELLVDVKGAVSAAASRQEAAQVLFNMVDAECVLWSNDKEQFVADTKDDASTGGISAGEKYLGLLEWIGKYEGNSKFGSLSLNDGQIQISGSIDGKDKSTAVDDAIDAQFKSDIDLSLVGEEVSVLFKDVKGGTPNQPDDKDLIYGIYATGNTTVYNITAGDLQDGDSANNKIKFGDKEYKAEDDISTTVNYTTATNKDATAFDKSGEYYGVYPTTIKFIAEDGKINAAYVNTYKLARVTAVNSDKVSINNGVGAIKLEDNDVYEGVKKDDIVIVQTFYNVDAEDADAYSIVAKADVKSAELTGYKGTEKVTFDGTTYDVMGGAFAGTSIDSDFETTVADQIGETYDFYMIGKYVAAVKMTSDGAKNYAAVMGKAGVANNKADPLKVSIKKADGSEALVEVDTDGVVDVEIGDLIKYSDISDTKIKIKSKGTTTNGEYDKDKKTFDGVVATADAPLFVKKGNDYYVYIIRNLNNIADSATSNAKKIVDDGKVVAAYAEMTSAPSGASSDTLYGIVSDAKGTVKVDGTYYTEFAVDAFNKAGEASTEKVLIESTSSKLAKGDMVYFDKSANDIYSDNDVQQVVKGVDNSVVTPIGTRTAAAQWVKEYDAKGAILTTWNSIVKNGATYEGRNGQVTALDDDAVIAFVDANDDKGATDNGVPAFDGVKGHKNVVTVVENGKIVGMFVDVDNNITEASAPTSTNLVEVKAPDATIAKGSDLTADLAVSVNKTSVTDGDEIKYTVTIPANTKAVTADKKVTITLPANVTAKSSEEVVISGDTTNVTKVDNTAFKITTTGADKETTVVFTVTVNASVSAAIEKATFAVANA